MSYLVLARKWRPKRFAELVGQEHVVRALTNALQTGRVHHAFLFTGTRGVGKTTIARIFAKSLNCERGTGAEPCGECEICRDVDAGRFLDLIEIDAASNTGVDDVREVIENAQYMPARGRVKVYLIDEVHMLSKQAFNALLKTLEEPPEHVKFLLATTDPQKLPVTVLSRCMQFNLKRLDEAQISGQMRRILEAEGIAAEAGAITQLARAADGSLRDGLSLLDQAIAYAGGTLDADSVARMLGTVDRTRIAELLAALADGDGRRLLDVVAALAELAPDWAGVLATLAERLHRIQVRQLLGEHTPASEGDEAQAEALAARVRPELVQLWYQMAIEGGRDLALAPSPQIGAEMALLRMLAFRPLAEGEAAASAGEHAGAAAPRGAAVSTGASAREHAPADAAAATAQTTRANAPLAPPGGISEPAVAQPLAAPRIATARPAPPGAVGMAGTLPATQRVAAVARDDSAAGRALQGTAAEDRRAVPPAEPLDAARWLDVIAQLSLQGPARQLVLHSAFEAFDGETLRLVLTEDAAQLDVAGLHAPIAEALRGVLGVRPRLAIRLGTGSSDTAHQRDQRERASRQAEAEAAFRRLPEVQRLVAEQGARILVDTIRPFDD
jgi:DNA polymerase-3 subunit gamma/tau